MKESPVRILPLERSHIGAFRQALDAVAKERKYLFFAEAPPIDELRTFLGQKMTEPNVLLVAFMQSHLIGWCDIIIPEMNAFRHNGRLGIGVVEPYRRQGIGSRLMAAAISKAKTHGLLRIELEVLAANLVAIDFFKSFAFRHEGSKRNACMLNHRLESIEILARLL